ncbi:dihydroorotase [Spirulina sp. CS-785/01]|uniref:dihydroorotase n=1 Tax=Spirulina sp. CS-785/01 TaxID=3021716 RepID=UPI0023302206|nr:dihydroorotase [Spirulina sp. CS-785/01]MDB9312517.1 dihydroorotase [Spirulina sp. CS-785/01]
MNARNTLINHVRVLDPVTKSDRTANVHIVEGKISQISSQPIEVPPDTETLNGTGLILAPGLVDLYSQSGEPGYEDRETLTSLANAALSGGYTRLTLLPNTNPPLDNPASLSLLQQKSPQTPQISLWVGLTQHLKGEQMTELAELATSGIVGFADGYPLNNWSLLRRVLEYSQPFGKPVGFVPYHPALAEGGVMREGSFSIQAGLPGNPAFSETTALASLLELLPTFPTPVHIMRVSTARSVELIADGKARGLPITASTTWLHLLLDTQAISSYNPNLRLNPPLGNPRDKEALREGVKAGVIDAVAVDHTPYTYEEKTVAFGEAPPGAIGLELALPLLWQHLVATGDWTALELWQALSVGPQWCLQQQPLQCAVGENAELVLFNPQQRWEVNTQTLQSKSANTSWLGQEIRGKVVKVISN